METKSGKAPNKEKEGPVKPSKKNEAGVVEEEEVHEAVQTLQEDPWMNDLILDNVFRHCSREMIGNCRLVSQKWYTASLPVWMRVNPVIKLVCKRKPEPGREKYIWNWRRLRFMSDFMQTFVGSSSVRSRQQAEIIINGMSQFKKFDLRLDKTFASPEVRMNEFWNGNGAWITSLKLFYEGPMELDFFRRIFYCHYTPNLEELDVRILLTSVDLSYSSDDEDAIDTRSSAAQRRSASVSQERSNSLKSLKMSGDLYPFPFDWKEFLGLCPKLENLDVSSRSLQLQLKSILTAIKEIRTEDKKKLRLKSLSWCDIGNGGHSRMFSSAVPQLLKESQLGQLQSLSVYFGKDAPNHLIQEMCTMHSKSLKDLSFYRNNVPLQVSPFLGVPMTHLTSLVTEGKAFANLSFLRELPALRSLKLMMCLGDKFSRNIGNSCSANTIISATNPKHMAGVVLTSLTSFHCDYIGDFEPNDLSRLHDWMPALLRLELQLNSESFPAVCQHWPNLQHVVILGARIGDRGLVGLNTRNGKTTFNKPNITNLQDLQSFKVLCGYGCSRFQDGDKKLTVLSVQHGLSKLARLKKVVISPKASPYDIHDIQDCIRKEMPYVNC